MDISEINEKLEEARNRTVKVKLIERKSGDIGYVWRIVEYCPICGKRHYFDAGNDKTKVNNFLGKVLSK